MSSGSTRPCVNHERTSSASTFRCGFVSRISDATVAASPPRSSRSTAHVLLVHHPPEHGRHAGALVDAERARVPFGVDAETDAALAAPPEAAERVLQERTADPTPTPATA